MRETSPMRKYSLSGITGSEALLPLRCFFFSAVMTEALRAPDGRLQHWHSTTGLPALHGARTCTLVARTLTRNNSGVDGGNANWGHGRIRATARVDRRSCSGFAARRFSAPLLLRIAVGVIRSRFRQRKTASANSNRGGQLLAKK